ncbi:MAG: hypothetical protein HFJ48_01690 [Clostridia bacterium]|nr:hypothetical protein [Clostridia bacterium]
MKATILFFTSIGIMGGAALIAVFTINFIKISREMKREIVKEKKNELAITLVFLMGFIGLYVAIGIGLLVLFLDVLKNYY